MQLGKWKLDDAVRKHYKSWQGAKPMNAIQFIQKHGVDKAREVVEGAPDGATHLSDDASYYVNA